MVSSDEPLPSRPARTEPQASAPTDADRERAVDLLTRHYAADRLTDAELQARLDRVYVAASATELQRLLADLPEEPEPAVEPAPKRVRALLSGQEQRLAGIVPRHLELQARLGYVELDLTRASFQKGLTEIHVNSFAGYVEIRLPAGVRAESTGHALLGYFSLRGAGRAREGDAPTVRISGRAVLGYMECHISEWPPAPDAGGRLPR